LLIKNFNNFDSINQKFIIIFDKNNNIFSIIILDIKNLDQKILKDLNLKVKIMREILESSG
jgi:hypothetical protein